MAEEEKPDSPSTVDLLKEAQAMEIVDYMETDDVENQKLTNDNIEKSKVNIKEDDVETGPEKLEKGTPDLEVKEETVIENNTPNNNKNNTQMAVKNQKDSY